MSKLVIVESPAKAKTIRKYLGDGYEVMASMGHIRDLPASQLGIDVERDYNPQYINIKGKEKLIKELKGAAKQSEGVLLATDPDREGEAISWHLAHLLGLDVEAQDRVTFGAVSYTHLDVYKRQVQAQLLCQRALLERVYFLDGAVPPEKGAGAFEPESHSARLFALSS